MNAMYIYAKNKVKAFFKEEKGAVDIVAIVVMVGIAVLLAALFKDQISSLLENLLGTIGGKATDIVN